MRLYNVSLQGFRRFETHQNFNVSGKLTAVVGPNEAGKTSLLKAISYFSDHRPIDGEDITNLSTEDTVLKLSFFLDQHDLDDAALSQPSWLDLVKRADGQIKYNVRPTPPRDCEKRKNTAVIISKLLKTKRVISRLIEITDVDQEEFARIRDVLGGIVVNLFEQDIRIIGNVIESLENESESLDYKIIEDLRDSLKQLIEFESSHNPLQEAVSILAKNVPKILDFTDEYRQINLPYNLSSYKHEDVSKRIDPSTPLAEILRLSEMDIDALKAASVNGNEAVKAGLLASANNKLEVVSRLAWSQSDAALNLSVNNSRLTVLVKNEKDFEISDQFSDFKSRSDGYKQFIALQIFTFLKKGAGAILLIDEIDQHLHYDAQADLIQILQNEENIGSVIYTTHSAGSLPEDMGTGVRMVRWVDENKKRSEIVNKFWGAESGAGFKPILFGMGAATLAFFPTRRALIGEGATEMLLLPALLREALDRRNLDFQIVHGLSHIQPTGLPMLDVNGGRVSFITDNDTGGNALRTSLTNAGVNADRIFSVGDIRSDVISIEDVISSDVWLKAVNRYIEMYGPSRGVNNLLESVPEYGRIAALPPAIKKEKVAFAYNILEQLRDNPNLGLIEPRLRVSLRKLGRKILSSLGVPA